VVKYWPEIGKCGYLVWRYLLRRDDLEPAPWTPEGLERIKKLDLCVQVRLRLYQQYVNTRQISSHASQCFMQDSCASCVWMFAVVRSTRPATWRPWLTKQRRRPVPGLVAVAGLSTPLGGGGHGDASSRTKKSTTRKMKTSSPWQVWKKRTHRVMESRTQPERAVGDFTDESQSWWDKVSTTAWAAHFFQDSL